MSDQPAIPFDRVPGCTGKEPFASQHLARRVMARWTASKRRRGKLERRPIGVYRCDHCHQWHLGGSAK